MIDIKSLNSDSGNAYVLFGYEAIQARPNLDPYTSTLRTNDETMQVYTSDVHIKHHARRGIKCHALAEKISEKDAAIFYEKEDETGKARDFSTRLQLVREAYEIEKADKKDALNHCLDLPLFGYVHAVSNENFNVTNAINTLFRPSTFHACEILSLGRNNAFPTLGKNGEVKESAGSATIDSLEYGFFLSLWEINLSMLRINARGHKVLKWDSTKAEGWLKIFINGLWRAYTTDRFPSFTQRSQFAQFVVGWQPYDNVSSTDDDVSFENPADLINKLDIKLIKSHNDAIAELDKVLPGFLDGWKRTTDNSWVTLTANNCSLKCFP